MVVILSPQEWGHIFISKHHYALEFSKKEITLFIEPPIYKPFKLSSRIQKINDQLIVIQIILPFPNWVRFKAKSLFQLIYRNKIVKEIEKISTTKSTIIDFGQYSTIRSLKKFNFEKKIYFPVDNFENLKIEDRGADKIFTVSSVIFDKFKKAGLEINWINHGLSETFQLKAKEKVQEIKKNITKTTIGNNIGYSGNLLIPFLDRINLIRTIKELPQFNFLFFGNFASDSLEDQRFIESLSSNKNVTLEGKLDTKTLAERLFNMDFLWICYNSDNKDYFLENSHKLLEYMSTGAQIVSSQMTIFESEYKNKLSGIENEEHKNHFLKLKGNNIDKIKTIEQIELSLEYCYSFQINKLID